MPKKNTLCITCLLFWVAKKPTVIKHINTIFKIIKPGKQVFRVLKLKIKGFHETKIAKIDKFENTTEILMTNTI